MPDQTDELKSEHSDNCLGIPNTLKKKKKKEKDVSVECAVIEFY